MDKLKLNIIALGLSGMALAACSDSFLDVDPKTSLFDQNYYKTVEDAEMALVGCYDGYQRTSSNGNLTFYIASEVLSDNCFGATGNTDGRDYQAIDRFDISQSPSDNNLFEGTWADYYAGIFRCNTLISKLDGIAWNGQEATRSRIEGETRFLRAIMYFDLVRLFENIPLLLEPTTANVEQADVADVYKAIGEDLKFAAENISYPAYSSAWAADNDGRATQWAAKAMLARVYLFYTGYYNAADLVGVANQTYVLSALENVISEGNYDLVPEYKNLWEAASSTPDVANNKLITTWAGRGNKEFVFTQKFNFTQDYNGNMDGNRWLVMLGLRQTNFSPYGQGWGACTVNPRFVSSFAANDTRRVGSVIDAEQEGVAEVINLKEQREYTGYYNKKYIPMCLPDGTTVLTGLGNGDFQVSQFQDFVVMRYADVLLMAAELGSANAQTYFSTVRTRAGLSGNVAPTKENIMAERRFEFAFEGLRYWDLLRQGVNAASAAIAESNVTVLSGGNDDIINISAANVTKTRGFMQIPNNQITLSNGVLKQNAGW